jgi:ATP-binding cassette subfamily C exporter for protease/lipase
MKKNAHTRGDLTAALWALRGEFLAVGLFSMAANLLMLAPTLYMLQVYDRVLVSRSVLTLLTVSLITLLLLVLMAGAEYLRSRVLVGAGLRLHALLGARLFGACFEAHLGQAGAVVRSALPDFTELRQFLTGHSALAVFDLPWVPIYVAGLFFLHPMLGALAIGFALVQASLAWFGHRRSMAPAQALSEAQSEVDDYLQSKLRNAEVVESMGMLAGLKRRWQERHGTYLARHAGVQRLTHSITAWSKWVRYSQQSLVLGAGALLVIDGQLSPGAMIAANVLMSRALAPLDMLTSSWRSFLAASQAFDRLQTLLRAYPRRPGEALRVRPAGFITLKNVGARAAGRAASILEQVSLQAEPGSVTVVLGSSGSGKSTLARVIVGVWPDFQGEVLLDGQPLAGWDRGQLGSQVGYLPQEVELFDGTVAENIARLAAIDPDKVIAAARSAGLHQMILRLAQGYETPIGDAGSMLSGGQRQRIGLARAIYGDPLLLVLDEPNANLDEAGEAALVQVVQELRAKGKTVFLITHRPDAVALADQVLVLRAGRVHLQGPPAQVLAALEEARQAGRAPASGVAAAQAAPA